MRHVTQVFELFLFTPDPDRAAAAVAAGLDGIVVDWERAGKDERQEAADTEVNRDTVDDLRRVRTATSARILCRVNPVGPSLADEIDAAASAGADEVLVPMVRASAEVETALDLARGRVGVGILIETVDAVRCAEKLATLPISRVFVGLNDLAIERRSASIFSAVLDGTVEHVRAATRSVPFGVAGMTLPEAGHPIPCRLLVGELMRLRCGFTFLRRSFRADMVGREISVEVPRMRDALRAAAARTSRDVTRDRVELELRISELEVGKQQRTVGARV